VTYKPTFTIDGREYKVVDPDEHRGAVMGDFFLLLPTERQMARERVKRFLENRPEHARGMKEGVVTSYHRSNGDFELLVSDLEILLGEREN
jgi:hypothetical protein